MSRAVGVGVNQARRDLLSVLNPLREGGLLLDCFAEDEQPSRASGAR